jgi:ABC-type bacteriocin/lantibiotic exporter with double-glycine peptidase domain
MRIMNSLFISITKSFKLLSKGEKKSVSMLAFFQAGIGFLDVLGLLITSFFITYVVSTSGSEEPARFLEGVLDFLGLSESQPREIIIALSILTLFTFMFKTVFSLIQSRRLFRKLVGIQTRLSGLLFSRIINGNYEWLRKQSPLVLSQTLISGVSASTVSTIGHSVLLFSELILITLMFLLTIVISPAIATALIFYLLGVIYILNRVVGSKVSLYNSRMNLLKIESETDLHNSLKLIREIKILGRYSWFESKSTRSFSEYSDLLAKDIWIQQLPKYALEIAMLLGSALILAVGTFTSSSENVITTLAIYLAISTRLFPSLLRIQSSLVSLFAFKSLADSFYDLYSEKASTDRLEPLIERVGNLVEAPTSYGIKINNLSFKYDDSSIEAISDMNLIISEGEKIGLVGPSGSGKTTLSDILLGLLEPSDGQINIGEMSLIDFSKRFPGGLSYLPQDITFTSGTVLENICIGLEPDSIDMIKLGRVLEADFFKDVIDSLPKGLNTTLTTDAKSISGGQRQKIGIARTLYSDPRIVVMDEATSSLDADSEWSVMSSITELGEKTTLIFVAHRLSSLVNFKRIIYLEHGKIIAEGNFSELRSKVKAFDRQATLLGL